MDRRSLKLGNGRYRYPLTITDHASRYLPMCEALGSMPEELAVTTFQHPCPRNVPSPNLFGPEQVY